MNNDKTAYYATIQQEMKIADLMKQNGWKPQDEQRSVAPAGHKPKARNSNEIIAGCGGEWVV